MKCERGRLGFSGWERRLVPSPLTAENPDWGDSHPPGSSHRSTRSVDGSPTAKQVPTNRAVVSDR